MRILTAKFSILYDHVYLCVCVCCVCVCCVYVGKHACVCTAALPITMKITMTTLPSNNFTLFVEQ